MNDKYFPLSPRKNKRLKTEHDPLDISSAPVNLRRESDSLDNAMGESTVEGVMPLLDQSHSQLDVSYDILSKERECGMTELVSPNSLGFRGILKKRYTDFLVNEILLSGVVVHLDSLEDPSGVNQKNAAKPEPSKLALEAIKIPSVPAQETATATKKDDAKIPQTISHHVADEKVNSSDEADGGVMLIMIQEIEHCVYENRASTTQSKLLELDSSSNPRKREKILLRHTSSGFVEVHDENEANLLLAEMKAPKPTPQISNDESLNVCQEDKEIPQQRQEPVNSSPSQWQAFAKAPKSFQISGEDRNLLVSYLSIEVVNATLALYELILNSPLRKVRDYGIVKTGVITNRETRTNVHGAIRRIFNSHLETITNDDGVVIISASAPKTSWAARTPTGNHERGRKPYRSGKPGWEELGGDYLHFTLYKENKDTMEVISFLARQLDMRPNAFQFAGTKDRRGITVQRVSVYRVFASRMMKAGRALRNAKIGNFEYQPHGLQLGDLEGNEFVITLRDCKFEGMAETEANLKILIDNASEVVRSAIESLKDKGFINYYGLQRFGTFSTRTDMVGLRILQGDFKAAIEAILDYSPTSLAAYQNPTSGNDRVSNDDKARAYALHLFQASGKPYQALDILPRKFSAEASIIRHLGKREQSNDFHGALMTIQRNLRLMYVHAYQSLVWNVAASERWKRFGNQILEGDLVLVNEHKDKAENPNKLDETDVDGETVVHPFDEDRAGNADDIFTRARALTKDEAASGLYSIFDVVLPTPGFDILYPANEIADVYTEFMASDRGGGLDPLNMRRKSKDFSLSGSYRKLLARPSQHISSNVQAYQHEDEQFVQTDLDYLIKNKNQPQKDHHFGADNVSQEESSHNGQEDGEIRKEHGATKLAVVLKLQLGASQYATMALRELMKAGGLQVYKPDFGAGR